MSAIHDMDSSSPAICYYNVAISQCNDTQFGCIDIFPLVYYNTAI